MKIDKETRDKLGQIASAILDAQAREIEALTAKLHAAESALNEAAMMIPFKELIEVKETGFFFLEDGKTEVPKPFLSKWLNSAKKPEPSATPEGAADA